MNFLLRFAVISFFFQDIRCIILRDVIVPPMFLIDGKNSNTISLDCQFDLEGNPENFVLRWFKDNEIIYQWIQGQTPSIFPNFKNNAEYEKTTDPIKKFTGLLIVNPSIESTGVYKCVIHNSASTASMEKKLQIVDITNYTLALNYRKIQNETHLECFVDNVYPEPSLSITTNDDDHIVTVISSTSNAKDNGFFKSTTLAVIADEEGIVNDFICRANFIDLPFNLTTTITAGKANNICSTFLYITLTLILFGFEKLLTIH